MPKKEVPASKEPPAEEIPARPRLSVVIVSRNDEEALRRCLEAIEASRDRERFEVFVVDAASFDGCPRMDAEFPWITLLRLPRNFGRTRLRNIAVRSTASDVVLFLEPCVEVRQEALTRLAETLETREDAAAAAIALESEAGDPVAAGHRLPDAAELAEWALNGTPITRTEAAGGAVPAADDLAWAIRKSFLQGMNYLDERRFAQNGAPLEVAWQVRNAGRKFLLADGARAVLHQPPEPEDAAEDAADRVSGAAAWIGKHNGIVAGISFRINCFFKALGSGRLGLAWAVATARRIDGT